MFDWLINWLFKNWDNYNWIDSNYYNDIHKFLTREEILKKADEALYERRNASIEQERRVKENELNTEIAIENKKKQIKFYLISHFFRFFRLKHYWQKAI